MGELVGSKFAFQPLSDSLASYEGYIMAHPLERTHTNTNKHIAHNTSASTRSELDAKVAAHLGSDIWDPSL